MRLVRKAYGLLSSKALLIWLVGGWVVYYVTLAVWSKEAFAGFISGLGKNPLIQAPYIVFLVCLLLNIIRVGLRAPSVARPLRKGPRAPAQQGLLRLLLWIFLPLGVFLFLTGYFVSATLRKEAQFLVGGGEVVKASPKDEYRVKEVIPALDEETFTSAGQEAWVFQYEPRVVLSRGDEDFEVGAFPPKRIRGVYFHILNFGIAPGVRLSEDGSVLQEGYAALRLLPPGSEDDFELPPFYKVSLRLAPERTIEKGAQSIKLYSLKSPSYETTVYKGQEVLFEGNSKDGIGFEGRTLTFFEPGYWVLLVMVKDPGVMPIVAGIFFILVGIPLVAAGLIIRAVKT